MPGPWQTHVGADGWEPMDLGEVIVGEVHILRSDEAEQPYLAGLWRVTGDLPAPFAYDFRQNETIHVLDGVVVIDVEDGPVLELSEGGGAPSPGPMMMKTMAAPAMAVEPGQLEFSVTVEATWAIR